MDRLKIEITNSEAIYAYKLVADNGGAPCIYRNILSLSICKPQIRMDAKIGDWIIGFGGKSRPELKDRVIYVAQVTEIVDRGDYYALEKFKNRPDCIYRRRIDADYEWIPGSKFHDPYDLPHDLGSAPNYERARNLLSEKFVYFGRNSLPAIDGVHHIYDELPRNYVKNHEKDVREQLKAFISELFEKYGCGKHGVPTDADTGTKCYSREDDEEASFRC